MCWSQRETKGDDSTDTQVKPNESITGIALRYGIEVS
jgi:hypothetical protein